MKINTITVDNVLGVRTVDVRLSAPVTMFVGGNGQGKTSILDAVRLALIAEPARGVNFKKDYGRLIREGAGTGQAQATVDGRECWLLLPTGKGAQLDQHPALPIVLDPSRLAALKPAERKALLFGLLGVKATAADVKPLMVARGLDAKKIERVLPMLRAGFDEAATVASEAATQAKGAWKLVTNEQWGSDKGGSWKAPQIEFDAAQLKRLTSDAAALDQQLAMANQALGALRERRQQAQGAAVQREQLQTKIGQIGRIKKKLDFDERELAKAQSNLAQCQGGPRDGLLHELGWSLSYMVFYGDALDDSEPELRVRKALDDYEAEHGKANLSSQTIDADRAPGLKEAVNLLTNAVINSKRDLAEAEAAVAQLEALESLGEPVKESDFQAAEAKAQDLTAKRSALTADIDAANAAKRAADGADAATAKAAELHADITQWIAVAEALGPNGIPGELVGKALGPVNSRLTQSAEDTGWQRVLIDNDMAITYGGRSYALLSESEKWRVDAMLGEAVANVSGLRLLMLDRFDVLELAGRAQALTWLSTLAINNEVDTVLVGATLKAATGQWPEGIEAFWVSNGMCQAGAAPAPAPAQADLIPA